MKFVTSQHSTANRSAVLGSTTLAHKHLWPKIYFC